MKIYLSKTFIRDRALLGLLIAAFYWSLGLNYSRVVAPVFNFGGFDLWERPTALKEYALLLLIILALPFRARCPRDLFLWVSALFLLVPATVLSSYESKEFADLGVMYFGVFLAAFASVIAASVGGKKSFPMGSSVKDFRPAIIALVWGGVLIAGALWFSSPSIKTFAIGEVYEHRLDFNSSIQFPLNYLVPMFGNAFSALVMAYALSTRNIRLAFAVVAYGVFLFGVTTHKLFAFVPIYSIAWFYLLRYRFGVAALVGSLVVLNCLTLVEFVVSGEQAILGNLYANRLMFIPSQIHYEFIEQFSSLGYQYWAESKVSLGFSTSNLSMASVNYIAEALTGDSEVGANTGWIANAYMNAGILGIVLYSCVIAVILSAAGSWTKEFGSSFVLAAFSPLILALVNSMDLLQLLLTGGLGAMCLAFLLLKYFLSRKRPPRYGAPKTISGATN